ncbi:hypothetical protein, partial [Sphingobacterium sp. UBA6645]|uniref:hypothetical protein n=1 Tax=Sphingobacterium sp. UBA6645 TaxID=1947511 RepID=UPI0026008BF4
KQASKQAEVGQSPTCLPHCAANEILSILQGYSVLFFNRISQYTVYFAVYRNFIQGLIPTQFVNRSSKNAIYQAALLA